MLSNKLLTNLTSELQFPTTRIPRIETESKIMEKYRELQVDVMLPFIKI